MKFTAEWCGPCKAVAPVVVELAREFDGRMDVLEVDIDQHESISARYEVRGVPTFILFENGEALAR
ncbi:MAG: thioredoxin family protein [Actinomycetota bacterium]|nr:thioredoxin family protein [Actinomycetota bacterium]